jgi:hypothetical protein
MWPTLQAGDIVRLEPAGRARPGDILAFERGGGLLVHRVVERTPEGIVCRGDNRLVGDGLTRLDEVIGRAVSVRSPGGAPLRVLQGGLRGRALAARPYAVRRARALARRLAGEVDLLLSQAHGETPAWCREALGTRWHGSEEALGGPTPVGEGDARSHVLQGDEVEGSAAAPTAASPAPRLVIAADTYCFLPPGARRALVGNRLANGPSGQHTVLVAFARTRRVRLARMTAVVRRVLAAIGVPAGDPGDAVVAAGPSNDLRYVRFFTAAELAEELRAAGAVVVAITPLSVRGVDLWQAEVRSSSGTR